MVVSIQGWQLNVTLREDVVSWVLGVGNSDDDAGNTDDDAEDGKAKKKRQKKK